MKLFIVTILIAFVAVSCYKDTAETLNPQVPAAESTTSCDTSNVGYAAVIQPIVSASCITCHSTTSPALGTFADLKSNSSRVITAISNGSMPQNSAKLSDCKINKFKAWRNQGFKQ